MRGRFEDTVLLALEVDERVTAGQRTRVVSRSWKQHGGGFSGSLYKGAALATPEL